MVNLRGFFQGKKGGSPRRSLISLSVSYCYGNLLVIPFQGGSPQIKISHLCFADDLFLFAKGNVDSVQITLDELTKFEAFSGMQVNKQKSDVFLAGIDDSVKATILDMTGFSMGRLPMKYLGVALISSKLSHSDCQPLLDKIMARIQSWRCNSLSFAGRLQLISSVLYNIQTYWCTMFIIPKYTCSKIFFFWIIACSKIEQIFGGFLWSSKDVNARKAKVGWKFLCLPKEEGGLGLRQL